MNHNDIILTGIPRSGTTLTCHLLNQLPNVVALHEPFNPFYSSPEGTPKTQLVDKIDKFFEDTRHSLLTSGQAKSKQFRGEIPDNPKGDYPWYIQILPNRLLGQAILGMTALRKRRAHHGIVRFSKPLTAHFHLCVKHNAAYTALLDELLRRHRCFCIIRNPLSILASWNSIAFDLREGDMTITSRLDADLSVRLSNQPNRLERQIMIVEWFFSRYYQLMKDEQVIRYEDLIARPAATLKRILPSVPDLEVLLKSKNLNRAYNRHLMRRLGAMLLERPRTIWHYYPPDTIAQLMEEL